MAFTGAYIATTAAVVSASSVAGPGGQVILNGGGTGRRQQSGILSVGGATTFFASTTFGVLCNGLTPGSGYAQLVASGPITLGNSTLSLVLGFEPPLGSSFEILINNGTGAITSTFEGLPRGSNLFPRRLPVPDHLPRRNWRQQRRADTHGIMRGKRHRRCIVAGSFLPFWLARRRHRSRSVGLAKTRAQRSRPSLELLECRCVASAVTNLADAGPGSLRDAIATTPAGGTVDFQPGLNGTISLMSATLAITQDVSVAGPGADIITVSGNNLFQVFNVAQGVTVTIAALTIADGTSPSGDGDGIYNGGNLTVTACTLSNNSSGKFFPTFNSGRGGGIYNAGTLILTGSTFSDNGVGSGNSSASLSGSGGGIYNSGMLTVTACTLKGNSAQAINNGTPVAALGGGIYNAGTLSVTASTLDSNSAVGFGGPSNGGGIYNVSTLSVTNSVFSGNRTGTGAGTSSGGGIYNSGMLKITASNITENNAVADLDYGGGLYNAGTLTLCSSTISGNLADGHVGEGGGLFNDVHAAATIITSLLSANVGDAPSVGEGGAIFNYGNLTLIGSTLSDNTAAGFAAFGWGGGIENEGTLAILASTFMGNSAAGPGAQGGGINNLGMLTIVASTFSGNSVRGGSPNPPPFAAVYGGGIANGGTLTILASTLNGNSVQDSGTAGGGGIANDGTLALLDSTVSDNSVVGKGGIGLITRKPFAGDAYGGGIFNQGSLTILESTLSGNSVQGQGGSDPQFGPFPGDAAGGGVYNGVHSYTGGMSAGTMGIFESTFSGNSAGFVSVGSAVGGGIDNDTGMADTVRVRSTILAGNNAPVAPDLDGSFNSLGHNLIGIGDGGSAYADSDLVGTAGNPIDAKLGPLQDNGGLTETMALLPGSPAIGAGALTDSEWDQRGPGYPRLVNDSPDIGAFEV